MSECKEKKCHLRCKTCQCYDKALDFCKEKNIEDCSKKPLTDFAQCNEYLIREDLVMF